MISVAAWQLAGTMTGSDSFLMSHYIFSWMFCHCCHDETLTEHPYERTWSDQHPAVPPYLEIDNIGLPADHAIYGHKTLFPPSTTCLFGFRQTRLAVVYHGWQNRLSTCGCRSWALMHVAGDDHSLQCCDHHHSQVNDASTAVGNTSLDFAFSPAVWHLQISWDFEHCLNYFQQMIGADYLCLWLH